MIDRKEHEQRTVDTEQLIVDLTPKLVEMAGILDKKSAARIRNNILTSSKVRPKVRNTKHDLPAIDEHIFEETLNSSQKWEELRMADFNSEMDINSDHPSALAAG